MGVDGRIRADGRIRVRVRVRSPVAHSHANPRATVHTVRSRPQPVRPHMDRSSALSWADARPFDHDPRAVWLPSASMAASARPEWPGDFGWPEPPAADDLLYARPTFAARASASFPLVPDAFSMGMASASASAAAARPHVVHTHLAGNSRAREIAIGRWTNEEHRWFLKGLEMFQGPAWGEISRLIGSRTSTQVRTHAQKFFTKLARQGRSMPHFDAQIRKERDRLLAQGVHVHSGPSASPSAVRPQSLLARVDAADGLGFGLGQATPTAAAAAYGLGPLNSMSPTAAKLHALAKKRPLSPSAELDAALADYAAADRVRKPRLVVDTSAGSSAASAAFPQLPSPPAWTGPLPSPIPLVMAASAGPADDSLPPMTRLLRRA